jgi:glycolate oxidase FAD binding subunit
LHESRTRPTSIELLNQAATKLLLPRAKLAAPDTPWTVLVGYEGNLAAVDWQVQQLVREVGTQCRVEAHVDYTATPLGEALVESAAASEPTATFKASLPPSATAAFCLNAPSAALQAHAGSGVVRGHWAGDLTKDQAASMLNTWRDRAHKVDGSVIVERCPSDWKAALNVWGSPRGDTWLMHEVKRKFDPRGIFNPGRFVDGI